MKQHDGFLKQLLQLSLLLAIMLFLIYPATSYANDSVFDCIEDEENCEEEKTNPDESGVPENFDEENEGRSTVGLTAWDYIKTFFALIFVVVLLYGLLKFVNRRSQLHDKNRLMKNMGGLSLGQQKSVQLIVVGNTYYLVGVGEDIRLLKEITDQAEIAALLEHYEEIEEIPFKGPFEKLLGKIMPFQKKEPKKENQQSEEFSEMLNERLSEIKAERKRQIHRLTKKEQSEDD